jgi:O-antigen/teichoic acid export membrane protein
MPIFRYFVDSTSWLFLEKIVRSILILSIGFYIARYLGPEKLGVLGYAQSIAGLLAVVPILGLENGTINALINNHSLKNKILGTVFVLQFLAGIIVFSVIFAVLYFFNNPGIEDTYIILLSLGMVFQSFGVIDYFFQSRVQSKVQSKVYFLQLVVSSITKVLLIYFEKDLLWFVISYLLDVIYLSACYVYFYKSTGNNIFLFQCDAKIARSLLKKSWPLIISALATTVYIKTDQIMIKNIIDDEGVGIYIAATRLVEVLYIFPIIVSNVAFPLILKHAREDFLVNLSGIYALLIFVSIFSSIFLVLFSIDLVDIFYGDEFMGSSAVLSIYSLGLVFVFIGILYTKWLVLKGYEKKSLYRNLAGAIVNLILNYIFIPIYGIEGAAYSTLFSLFVSNIGYDFFDKKTREHIKVKIGVLFVSSFFYGRVRFNKR